MGTRGDRELALGRARDLTCLLLMLSSLWRLGLAQGAVPPPPVTMLDLTVPKERLPAGCSLKANDPAPSTSLPTSPGVQVVRVTPQLKTWGLPPTNPWVGTDRHILAALRRRVDAAGASPLPDADLGIRRMPDAPPPTYQQAARDQAAELLAPADGIQEGYAATYSQSGADDLTVAAVRFEQSPGALAPVPADKPADQLFAMGLIRVVLHGPSGACGTAVSSYLKALGK
jgi:hypothetical protein